MLPVVTLVIAIQCKDSVALTRNARKRTQSRKRALLHDFAQHFSNEIKVTHDNHLCDAHFKTLSRKFELLSLTELSTRPPVLNADNNNNNNNGVEEFSNDNDNLNDRNNNNNDSLMRPLLQSVPILTPLSDANMNSSNSVQTNMNYLNTVQTVQTNITVNNIILNIHPTECGFNHPVSSMQLCFVILKWQAGNNKITIKLYSMNNSWNSVQIVRATL